MIQAQSVSVILLMFEEWPVQLKNIVLPERAFGAAYQLLWNKWVKGPKLSVIYF
ncbi:hypothetical protein [Bradyrhizobium sp. WU425]|uniref:hypothetical protein n=1 Tax=Bradyrhizobium sp. WU425 TaxID=187029 RepID=UPI001E45DBCF|nr:hypothetical protein [Bradyrhizobium canariense]UFW72671.1 hypothetical protein BcanWU425_02545 [Bradyrhizobium canariense]